MVCDKYRVKKLLKRPPEQLLKQYFCSELYKSSHFFGGISIPKTARNRRVKAATWKSTALVGYRP